MLDKTADFEKGTKPPIVKTEQNRRLAKTGQNHRLVKMRQNLWFFQRDNTAKLQDGTKPPMWNNKEFVLSVPYRDNSSWR